MKKTETYICVSADIEPLDGETHGTIAEAEGAAMHIAEGGGRVFVCRIESVAESKPTVSAYSNPPAPRKPRADKGRPRGPKAPKPRAHAPDSFAEAKAEAARREAEGGAT